MDFSIEVADLLLELKRFNYKPDFQRIHRCYEQLFDYYMGQMAHDPAAGDVGLNFLNSMSTHTSTVIHPQLLCEIILPE